MAIRLFPASHWGIAALGTAVMLTGCASKIMKNYIGAPISCVMLDYGPPENNSKLSANEQA